MPAFPDIYMELTQDALAPSVRSRGPPGILRLLPWLPGVQKFLFLVSHLQSACPAPIEFARVEIDRRQMLFSQFNIQRFQIRLL
jgi:hypothetical protein